LKLINKTKFVHDLLSNCHSNYYFGELSKSCEGFTDLPKASFGLIVNSDSNLDLLLLEEIFIELLVDGVEWFCAYGSKAEAIHDFFDEVYLNSLRFKGEVETGNNVLLSVSDKTLKEALESFDLTNQDRSGNHMEDCVVLE
jgi:hypothetical protein